MVRNKIFIVTGVLLLGIGVWQVTGVGLGLSGSSQNASAGATATPQDGGFEIVPESNSNQSETTPGSSNLDSSNPDNPDRGLSTTPVPINPQLGSNSSEGGNENSEETNPEPAGPTFNFDTELAESYIVEYVNDERSSNRQSELSSEGETADTIQAMARSHSEAMADAGERTHMLNGNSSADRYQKFDLDKQCEYQVDSYIESPENNAMEAIAKITIPHDENDTEFSANESDIAQAVVGVWADRERNDDGLWANNAGTIGVGVAATNEGEIYVTANVCD